jgi:phage/plasmid-associated DNA primase
VVRAQNSRIKNFVEDRLEFQDDTFTSNADIYEAWKLWLERHPDTSTVADAFMLRNAFSRFLGDVIGESARRGRVQRTPSTEDSHSSVIATYGWYGLRLKSEPTPTPGGVMVEDVRP